MYIWEESEKIGDSFGATFKSLAQSDQKLFSVKEGPLFTTMKTGLTQITQKQKEMQQCKPHWVEELEISFNPDQVSPSESWPNLVKMARSTIYYHKISPLFWLKF